MTGDRLFDAAIAEALSLLPERTKRRLTRRREGLISMKKEGGETLLGRTETGQALYDLLLSPMSAKKAAQLHHVRHAAVLALRRNYRSLRSA